MRFALALLLSCNHSCSAEIDMGCISDEERFWHSGSTDRRNDDGRQNSHGYKDARNKDQKLKDHKAEVGDSVNVLLCVIKTIQ